MVLKEKIVLTEIEIQKLDSSHKQILLNFRSYEQELVDFLIEDALDNQNKKISTTYLWFYKPTKELVGFVSVFTDAIILKGELKEHFRRKDILFKTLPALKMGKLCVSDDYLGRGIGTLMIEFVLVLAQKIGKEVGLRFITVDAKRNADSKRDSIHFYKKFAFEILKQREKETTPMYKDLVKE